MSKHLGNILEPIPLMDRHGADAVRWFMLAGGSPWSARRVGHETLSEVVRKVLLTYWNTAELLHPLRRGQRLGSGGRPAPARAERPLLDRWALAELAAVTEGVTTALEDFDTQTAGRLLAGVRRRPVQLVRPPVPPPLLGRRPGGAGHAARGARRPDPAHGAVHAVRDRGGLGPARSHPGWPDAADSVHLASLADGRRGRPRRRAGRAGGPRPPAGRARPLGPHVGEGAHPAAAGRAPSSRRRAGPTLPRDLVAEVADELNVLDMVELLGRGRRRAGRRQREDRLPRRRPAAGQAGAGRGQGGRRRGPRRADRRLPGRHGHGRGRRRRRARSRTAT